MGTVSSRVVLLSCPPVFCRILELCLPFLNFAGWNFCLPYFYTWCGPSANLECRSEMCCMRLAGNKRTQKIAKNSTSGHHRTNLSGFIFATKACIDNRKKTS